MIGVVGGVGSHAGIDLIKKIYNNSCASSDQNHLPVTMISIPHKVGDRTEYLLGKIDQNPGEAINEIITMMVGVGARIIGVPCNTAHVPVIFDQIIRALPGDVRVLHLIEEVGRYLHIQHPAIKRVGVLCTTGTYNSGIYPHVLSSFGLDTVQPPQAMQLDLVHPAIYDPVYGIKARSMPVSERSRKDLLAAAQWLSDNGSEAIVLGCTEISLALDEGLLGSVTVIDSTNVFAKALVNAYKEMTNQQNAAANWSTA